MCRHRLQGSPVTAEATSPTQSTASPPAPFTPPRDDVAVFDAPRPRPHHVLLLLSPLKAPIGTKAGREVRTLSLPHFRQRHSCICFNGMSLTRKITILSIIRVLMNLELVFQDCEGRRKVNLHCLKWGSEKEIKPEVPSQSGSHH